MIFVRRGFLIFLLLNGCLFHKAEAQKVYTYDFSDGLKSYSDSAPDLHILGTEGKYLEEVLPELGKQKRTVYQFEANSGLQFNNREGYDLMGGSYTVEIYFRLDELESWKRVLDFKNRKTDNGCYIYEGRLNFFNFATGEKAPVKPKEYIHYVFSRDADTRLIKMYVDGESKVEFTDPSDEAVLGQAQVLNFFQDDLIAKNEASPGAVALIRLYDRVMTPIFVQQSFKRLARTISEKPRVAPPREIPAPRPEGNLLERVVVKAAPTIEPVEVTGKVFNGRNLNRPINVDVIVRRYSNDSIVARAKAIDGTYSFKLKPLETYKITAISPGFVAKSIVVTPQASGGEMKTLVSLREDSYDKPISTLPFSQSDSTLSSEARSALDTLTDYMKERTDLKFRLFGHTDNVGDFDKNISLSAQRAVIARDYLVRKGIDGNRVDTRGYGPTRPMASNNSESTRRLNRRVEVWAEPIKR